MLQDRCLHWLSGFDADIRKQIAGNGGVAVLAAMKRIREMKMLYGLLHWASALGAKPQAGCWERWCRCVCCHEYSGNADVARCANSVSINFHEKNAKERLLNTVGPEFIHSLF